MAFASTITNRQSIVGDLIVTYGTYTNGASDAGGDINTAMDVCYFIKLQKTGDAVNDAVAVVNESFPCSGKAVTVVTTAGEDGTWMAIGEGVGY